MALDLKTTANTLRKEAQDWRDKAKQLDAAADLLDPDPKQKDLPSLSLPNNLPPLSATRVPLSELTVAKGAEVILQEAGKPLSREEIFDDLKKRGSGVTSVITLVSALSRAKDRFKSIGNSRWELRARLPNG